MKSVVLVALLVPQCLAASIQQPQFRASTSLVRLDVSVTDDRGAVLGLDQTDFVVEDAGVRQVVQVEESADAPLDLMLVAQPPPSIAYITPDQTARVAAGLAAFLAQMQDRDRLGAFVAGAPPTRLRALQPGRPSFDAAAFTGGVYAAPLDAIAAALRGFDEAPDRRWALIAFTNAADFRSTVSFESLIETTRRLGPAFVLLGTPVKVREEVRVKAMMSGGADIGDMVTASVSGYVFPARLQLLARRTGGVTVNLASGDPAQLMAEMFTWLRTRYTISYEPPPGKGWHPVSVRVSRRGAKVTVREGYFVD